MLHPLTELKYVSDEIGYGIFATAPIPKGTMTWVRDELDRIFTPSDVLQLSEASRENLLKYSYRTHQGDYFFCWDLARYVNHSFYPNTMITPLGFELAIRDISAGEELTNDYGTLNIIEAFTCASGPTSQRDMVKPDDLSRFHQEWDKLLKEAFRDHSKVLQPLEKLLSQQQREEISLIKRGKKTFPSLLEMKYLSFPDAN